MKKNVKRNLKLFCATAALCGAMSFSAFAAENHDEFKAEAAPIFEQMQELNAQINPLRQENNEISARYKEICASLKAGGSLPVDEETWDAVKDLRREITQYQSAKTDSTVKAMREQAKTAAEGGDYDGAMDTMEAVLQAKEERLEKLQAANTLWLEIKNLLGE